MSRAYNKLEVLEITKLTVEQIRKLAEDRKKCGTCEYCTMAYLSYKGEDLNGSCTSAERSMFLYACEVLEEKESEISKLKAEQVEHKTSVSSFYDSTKNFMKSSGYTHCYMCGSKL